ncbi:hypothetical protein BDN72DRAFT_831329, partial [Pluteus cervinus]
IPLQHQPYWTTQLRGDGTTASYRRRRRRTVNCICSLLISVQVLVQFDVWDLYNYNFGTAYRTWRDT